MTNNPTIDGVSRANIHHLKIHAKPFEDLVSGRKTSEVRNCADREFREGDHVELFLIDETGNPANKSIVRTITHIQRGYGLPDDICVLSYAGIDAPAVERQEPVAEVVATGGPHDREDRVLVELQAELPPVGTKIYAAPPEAAALQSTIARLETRITQLESEKELMLRGADVYKERIAELESGLGEPVAWKFKERVWATGLSDYVWRDQLEDEKPNEDERQVRDIAPLFTTPPAPVAHTMKSVMSAVCAITGFPMLTSNQCHALAQSLNACLDATAALNATKPTEWHDVAGDDEGVSL